MDRLEELEAKHGKGRVLDFTVDGVDIFFIIPTQGDHEAFVEKSNSKEANKTIALRNYVLSCVAEENRRDEMIALFERWPGVPDFVGSALIESARGGISRREKKSARTTSGPSGS
jgi:hypothetical protein